MAKLGTEGSGAATRPGPSAGVRVPPGPRSLVSIHPPALPRSLASPRSRTCPAPVVYWPLRWEL